ncbi:MAG: hypothetical protein FJ083_12590 [Cyanobacteria bacterium K_Offshore_surface_m2_239]|nr:hypothetical protein [Cyanobacteria bacterium K_Offshore_surface_m2_239]
MAPSRGHPDWLTLTELGRLYGLSAVTIGKVLQASGLRQLDGRPSPEALRQGLAFQRHSSPSRQTLWDRDGCAPHLEHQGLKPLRQRSPLELWADLISDLQQGTPAVVMSAEDAAEEVPAELVGPLNRRLRERGCSFQVHQATIRRLPRPSADSPAPTADAGGPHRRG